MTEFEIEKTCDMICQSRQKVQIEMTITRDRKTLKLQKKYTVIKQYRHHVLMKHNKGYHETFTKLEIYEMSQNGKIKWGGDEE